MGIKDWFKNLKPWQKGLFIGIVLDIFITTFFGIVGREGLYYRYDKPFDIILV